MRVLGVDIGVLQLRKGNADASNDGGSCDSMCSLVVCDGGNGVVSTVASDVDGCQTNHARQGGGDGGDKWRSKQWR